MATVTGPGPKAKDIGPKDYNPNQHWTGLERRPPPRASIPVYKEQCPLDCEGPWSPNCKHCKGTKQPKEACATTSTGTA
ncbi:GD10327 [Drosophila simulans]|uniref:GD10327 n=1 Tax=Drosophila simulans TaxID=7240 RepID=B4QD87_DROSI|nr:GD10327 [Drosophila simulans]